MTPQHPVLIIGGGPVGLAMANLLAARRVPVVLVERNASTSDEAKAISLDDESLRALQAAGLADKVLDIVVPGTGTRYYDRKGRPLFHARGPGPHRLGYPFKSQFAQPELERLLLDELKSRAEADIRFSTELLSVTDNPGGSGSVATLRTSAGTETTTLQACYVLACDGGRSTARELRGIGMTGTSHHQVWLVADTLGDPHTERYGMHHGTPGRPTVIVPGRDGRCRYEFLLHAGEGAKGQKPDFRTLRRLVAPYRTLTEEQVERCLTYTFNAVIADRWRDGNLMLLGDAAHMMPPFAGQGLNSGIRDAANLAWKIDEVWRGRATDRLLDTYEVERRPHATAMVRYSERLGDIVMTTDRRRAWLRDTAARTLMLCPPGRRYLTEMRFRPRVRQQAGLVIGDHPLTGTQLPQPRVLVAPSLRPSPLDEVLGPSFALLGIDVPEAAWQRVDCIRWSGSVDPIRRIDISLGDRLPPSGGTRAAVADADGSLEHALASARNRFILVKPDRYIAAVMGPDDIPAVARALTELTR
ncbi:bifunctional 3-(3-hydroxy-phenyl)propionate/3-hydroxycinnamic acid hydroxylase [Streptomyces galbus]|uniref:Bifunctional 3-(3-hydroxy-phenyl)propionate/3-hydroxycinnamic acid hydroxylase n=1 Tax=Streptomyces galbus TaxID=33898 RepID=A0A4U5WZG3_STRGB|nr:bifunctional 3-(3-hydroxy-phenyl)propionate/3-hydroxycinnamic acid hydroxylase [Streptomyces galbus]TKT08034.1 bifunctional 3-(3-hydroxy-phenyl)propionate/3-hydroxycinnamic acid hydroxylase [Streptomyces galbus]GHD42341.1 3-(3-hydroxy-phenyl)propionate/3-hydroxycinnamic acid hydroxylase [Streptomyces galbus]